MRRSKGVIIVLSLRLISIGLVDLGSILDAHSQHHPGGKRTRTPIGLGGRGLSCPTVGQLPHEYPSTTIPSLSVIASTATRNPWHPWLLGGVVYNQNLFPTTSSLVACLCRLMFFSPPCTFSLSYPKLFVKSQ
jgi:hypothetical protein